MAEKIADAGKLIPYARKHTAEKTGPKVQDGITLKELWPEPDWEQEIQSGMNKHLAAHLMLFYQGLAKKPYAGKFGLSDEAWETAYIKSIEALKRIFTRIKTVEQFSDLDALLTKELGLHEIYQKNKNPPLPEVLAIYAAGRGGKKTISAVTTGTYKQQNLGANLVDMGWPEIKGLVEAELFPIELKSGTWRIAHLKTDSCSWSNAPECILPDRQTAILQIRQIVADKQAGIKKPHEIVPTRPTAKDQPRIGPSNRAEDITSENLITRFNLKGIQFGNSVGQKDRQTWLNEICDALHDLAEILHIQPRWLGLGGNLGLAIGARGHGLSGAMAHYERSLQVINLTKENGAGSLAHEWAHAFDHRLTETIYPSTKEIKDKGEVYFATNIPLDRDIIPMIHEERQRNICSKLVDLKTVMQENSQYYQSSKRINAASRSGGYWTDPQELFARAFEAYIQDQLTEKNQTSPWLVHGTLETDYELTKCAACPYPVGIEREIINTKMEALLSEVLAKTVSTK